MKIRPAASLLLFCFAALGPAQTAEIKPGENLVVEGVPPIPASIAEDALRYTESRGATFTSWNPKRHEMLISTRFGNTNQVHVVKAPGGARSQLTFFPDRVSGGEFDPGSGDAFVFSKDKGGDEFFQLYRYGFAEGSITLLTDGKSRNTGRVWSNTGRWIAYGSTRRTGNDVDFYVVEPKDPKTDRRVVELSGGGWEVLDWSPDDRQLLVQEGISINESYLWLVDVATGQKTAADAQRRRTRGLGRGPVCAGRQGPLRHVRPRLGVPAPRLHGPRDQGGDVPDARHGGRGRVRPLARREDDRLRDEREGLERPPSARHGHARGEAGAQAPVRPRRRREVAPGRHAWSGSR